jgi:hypothetical protein
MSRCAAWHYHIIIAIIIFKKTFPSSLHILIAVSLLHRVYVAHSPSPSTDIVSASNNKKSIPFINHFWMHFLLAAYGKFWFRVGKNEKKKINRRFSDFYTEIHRLER